MWDPSLPSFWSCGARSTAFAEVAHRLRCDDNAIDIRRMWNRWAKEFYAYEARARRIKPKWYAEMYFLRTLGTDHLSFVARKF